MHLTAEERKPPCHPEFPITTPAVSQSSPRTPNKPSSVGLKPLCNFVFCVVFQHARHIPSSQTHNQMVNTQGETPTDLKNKQTNKGINQNYHYLVSGCVSAFKPNP